MQADRQIESPTPATHIICICVISRLILPVRLVAPRPLRRLLLALQLLPAVVQQRLPLARRRGSRLRAAGLRLPAASSCRCCEGAASAILCIQ